MLYVCIIYVYIYVVISLFYRTALLLDPVPRARAGSGSMSRISLGSAPYYKHNVFLILTLIVFGGGGEVCDAIFCEKYPCSHNYNSAIIKRKFSV